MYPKIDDLEDELTEKLRYYMKCQVASKLRNA